MKKTEMDYVKEAAVCEHCLHAANVMGLKDDKVVLVETRCRLGNFATRVTSTCKFFVTVKRGKLVGVLK